MWRLSVVLDANFRDLWNAWRLHFVSEVLYAWIHEALIVLDTGPESFRIPA